MADRSKEKAEWLRKVRDEIRRICSIAFLGTVDSSM